MLITFDLDGVLMQNPFQSGVFPHVRKMIVQAAKDKGTIIDETSVQQEIIREVKACYRVGNWLEAYNWDNIVRKVEGTFGVSLCLSIAELVEQFCLPPHIRLFPGACQTLEALTKQHHTLVALTNGYYKYQYPVVRALGIAHYFAALLTPEQLGLVKPQPEFFLAARELFDSKQHLHVGDTLIHDICGANQAGAISVWITTLPHDIKQLLPRVRAGHFILPALIAEGIRRDLCYQAYPKELLNDNMPDFVIERIDELIAIVEEIVQ